MKTDALLLKNTIVYDWWGLLTTKMNNWTLSHAVPLVTVYSLLFHIQSVVHMKDWEFLFTECFPHSRKHYITNSHQTGIFCLLLEEERSRLNDSPKTVTYNGLPAVHFGIIFLAKEITVQVPILHYATNIILFIKHS